VSVTSLATTRAIKEDAKAAGQPEPPRIPDAKGAADQLIGQLVAFIPGEAIALFVAALGVAGADSRTWIRWILLGVTLGLSVLWVKIHYMRKAKTSQAKKVWPWFEIASAGVATIAWSMTIPGTPWVDQFDGFSTRWGVLVAVVMAAVLIAVSAYRDAARAPAPATP